jgi:hypothetical protein
MGLGDLFSSWQGSMEYRQLVQHLALLQDFGRTYQTAVQRGPGEQPSRKRTHHIFDASRGRGVLGSTQYVLVPRHNSMRRYIRAEPVCGDDALRFYGQGVPAWTQAAEQRPVELAADAHCGCFCHFDEHQPARLHALCEQQLGTVRARLPVLIPALVQAVPVHAATAARGRLCFMDGEPDPAFEAPEPVEHTELAAASPAPTPRADPAADSQPPTPASATAPGSPSSPSSCTGSASGAAVSGAAVLSIPDSPSVTNADSAEEAVAEVELEAEAEEEPAANTNASKEPSKPPQPIEKPQPRRGSRWGCCCGTADVD